jgi:isopentenyl diphosphate isomerase/L-lactate dehydrogenase-like FMN-dependent dehydrogenase
MLHLHLAKPHPVTSVYMPTLFAVAEVRDAIEKLNLRTPVIGDGGIRFPGRHS